MATVGEDGGGESPGVGDRVAAYLPDGGYAEYAEYATVPVAFAFPLPDAVDLRTGGGAALVLTTAYGVLAGAARRAPGDTVLIHAAAGGGRGVDIVLDPVGGPTRLASFEVLAPFGRLATQPVRRLRTRSVQGRRGLGRSPWGWWGPFWGRVRAAGAKKGPAPPTEVTVTPTPVPPAKATPQ